MFLTRGVGEVICKRCSARRRLSKVSIPDGVSFDRSQAYRWLGAHRQRKHPGLRQGDCVKIGMIYETNTTSILAIEIDNEES